MLILGIDTSCDDTSAAVVEDGTRIISNIVSNQAEIHGKYGGIVPELASRRHVEMILPVVEEALKTGHVSLSDLSAVAVCHGPGLIGSLLVGCSFAKALSYSKNMPLVRVNHLEGHVLTPFLEDNHPEFPYIALIVSGGHTSLYIAEDFGRYIELGRTRDDAAGEAYDKIAKLLGLGYPGGPVIDALSAQGNSLALDFPRAYLPESLDFSFSGLKTAVLNFIKNNQVSVRSDNTSRVAPHVSLEDIAASFQASIIDVLVRKTEWAVRKTGIKRVALSGGVSANSALRKKMKETCDSRDVALFVPSLSLCTDNAAMIAAAGFHHVLKKDFAGLDMNPQAFMPL